MSWHRTRYPGLNHAPCLQSFAIFGPTSAHFLLARHWRCTKGLQQHPTKRKRLRLPPKIIKHQLIATCFSKGLLLYYVTKLASGGQGAIKPPGATCWSVTKNLDILSPRSHGKNPDQCILMCSHVNQIAPMFTTIFEISMTLWHSLASLISSTFRMALMPTTDPWHWLQDLQWPRFYCRGSDPSNSSAPTFAPKDAKGWHTNATVGSKSYRDTIRGWVFL